MALIPTLVALGVGFLLGMRWGGSPSNLLDWRPALWPAGLAGVALMVVSDAAALYGTPGVLLRLVALGLVLAFALSNIRTGGMVLVVAGFGADFLVTLLNWGMPVSGSAMVSAGIDRPLALCRSREAARATGSLRTPRYRAARSASTRGSPRSFRT